MNKKKIIGCMISIAVSLLVIFGIYYVQLPAFNVYSEDFWGFLMISMLVLVLPLVIIIRATNGVSVSELFKNVGRSRAYKNKVNVDWGKGGVVALVIAVGLPLAVLVLGGISSSAFFNAKAYADIITVQTGVFNEDMPETDSVTNIALMDSASATVLGNRTLGNLSDMVSQYELSNNYTQINYKGRPQKVSNLEYADFFRWINNRERGIPGFVMVDPVNNTAEYKGLSKSMKYVDSAYFGEDLMRKLRFSYPTKIFGSVYFEIDEEGSPYFIVSCMKPTVGLFGAPDVSEVIIFDPCDGSSEIYGVAETPSWIDIVYTGTLAIEKYDWYGLYSGGYWNSIISKVDCKQTTDDYGYITIGDDVWYFTGVTSISSDESNIGFIISNARTGEYKFYPVVGAEEYSAMAAAQGEVQEKGYVASFPSLVNISGEATYIMVLKDAYGLVKLYALVNVEQYNIVATGETQKAAVEAYEKLLRENGVEISKPDDPEENTENRDITVEDIIIVPVDGEATVYITAEDGAVYKAVFKNDESLILIRKGDKISVKCSATDIEGIYTLVSWTR